MPIHHRWEIVQKAECEFAEFVSDLEKKHELTDGELIKIFASFLATHAKFMIRGERHGDGNTPGDLEG